MESRKVRKEGEERLNEQEKEKCSMRALSVVLRDDGSANARCGEDGEVVEKFAVK